MPRKPSHTLTMTLDLSALTPSQRETLWSELSTAGTEREGIALHTSGGRFGVDVHAVGAILDRSRRSEPRNTPEPPLGSGETVQRHSDGERGLVITTDAGMASATGRVLVSWDDPRACDAASGRSWADPADLTRV